MTDTDTPLEFIGTSEDDLFEFPRKVKYVIGFALRMAQKGEIDKVKARLKLAEAEYAESEYEKQIQKEQRQRVRRSRAAKR